ncbi:MAG: hypothetical protein IVW56_04100 [Candidatus Binataceae bacterium]|nr:hypothetical protein [Candidatus Binataceae bacterium]
MADRRPTPAARRVAFRYKAYGLAIVADAEMPELPPVRDLREAALTRVRVTLRGATRVPAEPAQWLSVTAYADGKPWLKSAKVADGYLLRFPGLADFMVGADGRSVDCVAAGGDVAEVTLRHLVIDHVMPRVLNLLGSEALHATAVVAAAGACAFIGEAGTGKSTLAASFHLAGLPALCDDCLVLRDEGRILATPAYPGMRLWDDSFAAIAGGAEPGPPVAHYTTKTRLVGDVATFAATPQPLVRIYFLRRIAAGAPPAVERITPAAAFPELVGASFPLDLGDAAMLARHFLMISHVAASVPLRRLLIPTDFGALAAVRAAVIADLAAG